MSNRCDYDVMRTLRDDHEAFFDAERKRCVELHYRSEDPKFNRSIVKPKKKHGSFERRVMEKFKGKGK